MATTSVTNVPDVTVTTSVPFADSSVLTCIGTPRAQDR
jgi:hypothetical protein